MRLWPPLQPIAISPNARLYADRKQLLRVEASRARRPQTVAEVGVAFGDFSEFLIRTFEPTRFVAIDTFVLHELDECWGESMAERFGALTHEEYYRQRLSDPRVDVMRGMSWDMLDSCRSGSLDLIYLDAGHHYNDVRQDLIAASGALSKGGLVVVNDYTMFDVQQDGNAGGPYGVVAAVNEFLHAGAGYWEVVGFALQHSMFCDIAIRRV